MNSFYLLSGFFLLMSFFSLLAGIKFTLKDYIFVAKDSKIATQRITFHDFHMTDSNGKIISSPTGYNFLILKEAKKESPGTE
jgi:hypothetical protein